MNIVVAMKQVPDLQQIRIRNRQPLLENVPLTLGNIDKNALEAGVLLKEAAGGKVIVLSAGSEEVEDTVKEALAAGADEACLVIDKGLKGADGSVVALVLAAAIRKIDDVGLILCGEGSSDNYSGQVGPRVAHLLGIPQVGYASRIELKGDYAVITRSLEDGEEAVEVKLPAVAMIMGDINQPRIPSVSQILKAGRKPREIWDFSELGVKLEEAHPVVTLSNLAPENRRKQVVVKSVSELLQALKNEGVIGR